LHTQGAGQDQPQQGRLANKLARICYAVLRDHEPYGKLSFREANRKTNRTAYAVAG